MCGYVWCILEGFGSGMLQCFSKGRRMYFLMEGWPCICGTTFCPGRFLWAGWEASWGPRKVVWMITASLRAGRNNLLQCPLRPGEPRLRPGWEGALGASAQQMQAAQPWGGDMLLQWLCVTLRPHTREHGEKQRWDLAGAQAESASEPVGRRCHVLLLGAPASLQSGPAPLWDKQVLGNGQLCYRERVSGL